MGLNHHCRSDIFVHIMWRLCALEYEIHITATTCCNKSDLLVFDLGSRGPSTVTLIALLYDATCGGLVDTVIVNVKLLPAIENNYYILVISRYLYSV